MKSITAGRLLHRLTRMSLIGGVCLGVLGVGLVSTASAQPITELTYVEHPTSVELAKGFAKWMRERPDRFRFESRGTSLEGRPILMGIITDRNVPDDDKQIALFTVCHGPAEWTATTGLLRTMKWLLSNDPEAAEIRRRQVVLFVPYTDPDQMPLGKQTRQVYGGWADVKNRIRLWSNDGVALPEKHPEAVALQGIFDEYRPELYIDVHGFKHAERTMWDSTGISWSSAVARPFLHDFPRLIDEAAEEQGFLITRGEQDAGKIRTTSPIPGFPNYVFYLWKSSPTIVVYPYARYHTMSLIFESGSEESTVTRAKAALQLGHKTWRYERYESYPVNQVGIWTSVAVSAYGTNAEQRRKSRVELWQKNPHISMASASPPPPRDTMMGYVSTTPAGREKMRAAKVGPLFEELAQDPRFDGEGLKRAASAYPYKTFGGPRESYKPIDGVKPEEAGPIEHGIVIRLLVPYGDATITEVRRDGHLLEESDTNGYHLTRGPGVIVEIAIPPDQVEDFHIVSCEYDTPTKRRAGFTADDWELD